jgi:hypothetical protein
MVLLHNRRADHSEWYGAPWLLVRLGPLSFETRLEAVVTHRAKKHVQCPKAVQPFGHFAFLHVSLDGDIPIHHDLLYQGLTRFPAEDHDGLQVSRRFDPEPLPDQLSSSPLLRPIRPGMAPALHYQLDAGRGTPQVERVHLMRTVRCRSDIGSGNAHIIRASPAAHQPLHCHCRRTPDVRVYR